MGLFERVWLRNEAIQKNTQIDNFSARSFVGMAKAKLGSRLMLEPKFQSSDVKGKISRWPR
jgi:hypothetical protein